MDDGAVFACRHNGLQWGRNFIVAERYNARFNTGTRKLASMGPQLYRRGKVGTMGRIGGTGGRFNGAATLSSRKGRNHGTDWRDGRTLQWGRDITVAEIREGPGNDDAYITASMGPRHYRRGNSFLHMPLHASSLRFNGAATLPSRKLGNDVTTISLQGNASMGPRHYRRGNTAMPTGSAIACA